MLKRIFPEMTDRPDKGMFMAVILFGFVSFILLPVVVMLLSHDVWADLGSLAWAELVYHVFNAVIAFAMFKTYLGESFFNVQLYTSRFVKTVAVATLAMLTLALAFIFELSPLLAVLGWHPLNAYPINELPITMVANYMVREMPIIGTAVHTLVTPFAIAGMFYATGFAPFTCKKPWLGYLIIPIALVIPSLLDINWRGGADLVLSAYFLQLPIHLIACWSYHKADTIWAPITCLAIFNLVTSLLGLLPL